MYDQQRLRPACAYAQSDQSLCSSLECSMSVKLLPEHYLELLSFKGGCTGSSESKLVKMDYCWKSHAAAQLSFLMPAYATYIRAFVAGLVSILNLGWRQLSTEFDNINSFLLILIKPDCISNQLRYDV